jgi:hypothetical protein
LPCGWTKDGLETVNQLAKEVNIDRKQHDAEFDKAFKKSCEQEMVSNNTTRKRKRNTTSTNDLNEGEQIMKEEEKSGREEEQWVAKNVFIV